MLILNGREGLSLKVFGSGVVEIARDGETRLETWTSPEDLAERLRALGVSSDDVATATNR